MCCEMCDDNRFKIIEKAKADILESTNIDTSDDEMRVLDNFLFRCWQMGWLEKYDDNPKGITHEELLSMFQIVFPFAEILDYRPICHELFTDGKAGITIWLKNGDVIEYYPMRGDTE